MSNLKVSIITICHNNENDIRDTIESVKNQSYDNIEYIIVDGASSDKTLKIVNEYAEFIDKIISEPDDGIYDAINKGIINSKGDIFGLIHAGDQLFDKDVIQKIVNNFEENNIDASYGHSVIIKSNGTIIRVNKSPEYNKSLFKIGWMPSHQSIYLKRDLIEKFGLYRTDLGGSGDYEFVLRYFYFNKIRVKRLDEFILKFAIGGTSTSNYHKIFSAQRLQVKCWAINGEKPPFYMVPLKLSRKVVQFTMALWFNLTKKYETE
ncbi:glycosyltransferase [Aliifodinibius sp. S!AR15-10]|uniref:glycosyltransferase family 2 protein n=1 Tax=Aliifodinibius sp. S!AR15-10 TaxID=2950437 RepID=UPI002858CA13|nr:glycosyltransferase family 2 protein [Aliifodinibius sp. S!AR15-10]MDR8390260.1 glycosyltransferase [Aliifodinibius sp. S!AR15-10]